MQRVPLRFEITIPENIPALRGRHATTSPFGFVTSVRINEQTMATIDEAIRFIDPEMERTAFMRQVLHNAALAILRHRDTYVEWLKQTGNKDEQLESRTDDGIEG